MRYPKKRRSLRERLTLQALDVDKLKIDQAGECLTL